MQNTVTTGAFGALLLAGWIGQDYCKSSCCCYTLLEYNTCMKAWKLATFFSYKCGRVMCKHIPSPFCFLLWLQLYSFICPVGFTISVDQQTMPNVPLKVSVHLSFRSPQVPPIWIQFLVLIYICAHLNEHQLISTEIIIIIKKYFSYPLFWHLFYRFKKFDNKYLKKILIREHQPKSSIVSLYKKMEIKLAIEMAENAMKISESSTPSLQWVWDSLSFAE